MAHNRIGRYLHALLGSLLLLSIVMSGSEALAAAVGSLTHTSGPIMVRKANGTTKTLSIGSTVEQGDLIITQKRTYARFKFIDGTEATLKPNTQFKVEKYSYDQAKPKEDAATYNLIRGGLRKVTGQIGKRGNQDAYQMKTPTATIGIRGTIFTVEYIDPEAMKAESLPDPVNVAFAEQASVMSDAQPLLVADAGGSSTGAAGLFVYTWQGSVAVTNNAGTFLVPQNTAFQFQSNITQPVPIPFNAMPPFTPPSFFPPPGSGTPPPPGNQGGQGSPASGGSSTPPGGSSGSATGGGGGACQVPGSM